MYVGVQFRVSGANAAPGILCGGAAGFPKAALGFVYQLERLLAREALSLGANKRVAVGLSRFMLHEQGGIATLQKIAISRPWERKGAKIEFDKSVISAEMKADSDLHLLIESRSAEGHYEQFQKSIRTLLPRMRFAGGSVFLLPDSARRQDVLVGGEDVGQDWMRARYGVQFIANREDLMTADISPDQDALDVWIDHLALHAQPVKNATGADTKRWQSRTRGWIIPIDLGYAALHEPVTNRPGARNADIDSIIATSIYGLGEFVRGGRAEEASILWSSTVDRLSHTLCLIAEPLKFSF